MNDFYVVTLDQFPGVGTNYAECQAGQAFELVDLWQDEWGFLAIANEKIGFSAIGQFKTRWITLLSSSTPLPEKLALPWIDNFCPQPEFDVRKNRKFLKKEIAS